MKKQKTNREIERTIDVDYRAETLEREREREILREAHVDTYEDKLAL